MFIVMRTTADGRDLVVGTFATREEADKVCESYSFGYVIEEK